MSITEIKVGLLGLGTVGSGVIKLIEGHSKDLTEKTGALITVRKVLVQSLDKGRDVEIAREKLTLDPYEVLDDPEIDIIIEVMGSVETTFEYLMHALANGKHIVTANKDLVARHGTELKEQARIQKRNMFYEASVAG